MRGPVRVSVYQARVAVGAQRGFHGGGRDIHDRYGFFFFDLFAFRAHAQHLCSPRLERLREKFALVFGVVGVAAKGLVFEVVGSQRVGLHQQGAGTG